MTELRHLLVDRDGVLNVEVPGSVPLHSDHWEWEPAALPALSLASKYDLSVSVVTNQSAVARGEITCGELDSLHNWLAAEIGRTGVRLVGIFSCVHDSVDTCECRKPAPGLLLDAMAVSGIEPAATAMVGDDLRDIRAGDAAGVSSVLVRTGKGRSFEKPPKAGVHVEDDLFRALEFLLQTQLGTPSDQAADTDLHHA